jgi:hypothetical protein
VVRLVLILATVVAGCYSPSVVDCGDTCRTSGLCPDGLACVGGFCRAPGAAGSCTIADAATNDSMGGGACPPAPQGMMGCATAMPTVPTAPECLVLCAPAQAGPASQMYMIGGWRSAFLASASEEAKAKMLAGSAAVWIGLHRPANGSFMWVDGHALTYTDWVGGTEPTGTTEACAALGPNGWAAEPCTNTHPFLIRSPPMP